MTINDIELTVPFRVKDLDTGHYIYSILDSSAPGDLPFDIAVLPVVDVKVDMLSGMMEVLTETI